ncbi:sulfite exporter TauE/SafE family protein [Streptacidiphilus sp. 4-A2]|nr:sulfite exporter TauE/SafE family protein [Streptacidiphilus sp. 4-A2]
MSLALAGCLVGFLVGVSGIGGGTLLTPLLVLVFGLPPTAAVSSDLVVTAVLKLAGSAVHAVRSSAHLGLVGWLSLGGVPAALVGPLVTRLCGPSPALQSGLRTALGGVLLMVALATAWSLARRPPEQPQPLSELRIHRGRTLLLGLVAGLLIGFTSVGSGSVVAAVLLLSHPRLRPTELVATDLLQALPMTLAAAWASSSSATSAPPSPGRCWPAGCPGCCSVPTWPRTSRSGRCAASWSCCSRPPAWPYSPAVNRRCCCRRPPPPGSSWPSTCTPPAVPPPAPLGPRHPSGPESGCPAGPPKRGGPHERNHRHAEGHRSRFRPHRNQLAADRPGAAGPGPVLPHAGDHPSCRPSAPLATGAGCGAAGLGGRLHRLPLQRRLAGLRILARAGRDLPRGQGGTDGP